MGVSGFSEGVTDQGWPQDSHVGMWKFRGKEERAVEGAPGLRAQPPVVLAESPRGARPMLSTGVHPARPLLASPRATTQLPAFFSRPLGWDRTPKETGIYLCIMFFFFNSCHRPLRSLRTTFTNLTSNTV